MKIILFGLNITSHFAERALRPEHIVVGYSDSFSNLKCYGNCKFYKPSDLKNISFDKLIICVAQIKSSIKIQKMLEDECGISSDKIVDIRRILCGQKIDCVMKYSKCKLDGLIIGNSHALNGLNPSLFPGSWHNLAGGGEDIYYHYITLKICKERYWSHIKDLKYIIVDMWDYECFNYDLSKAKGILLYWSHGGVMEDIHNYKNNTNYPGLAPEELMTAYNYYYPNVKQDSLAEELFDMSIVKMTFDDLFYSYGSSYCRYKDYPDAYRFDKSLNMPEKVFPYMEKALRRYESTIEENKEVFDKLIKLCFSINEGIKIYIMLTPRSYLVEQIHQKSAIMENWRKEFESVISPYIGSNVKYINMKGCSDISENLDFYSDPGHLNAMGGKAYSSYVKDIIFGNVQGM